MRRSAASCFVPTPMNPFALWLDVAARTQEMLTASGQVIHVRVGRMAKAGALPSLDDQREFMRMGSEKVDAFSRSAQQWSQAFTPAMQTLALQAWQAWFAILSGAWGVAGSRTPAQAMQRHGQLVRTVMRRAPTLQHATDAAARLTGRALAPVHRTATANARRLGVARKKASG